MNKSSFARKKRLAYIKSIIFPSKLFHRFLLIILLPMLLIQSIGLYIFFDRHLYNIHKRLAFAISGEANIALALADGETPYNDIFREFNEETGLTLSYIDRFSINSDKGISKATKESFDAEFASYRFKKLANKEFLLQVKSKNNNFIQVLIPFKRLYNSTFHIFILWNIGLSILFLSMAVIFMKNQIKPINKLANAADIFGKGINDDKYLKISGAKEVKQATSAFLKMRDRIKKQVEQRTDMLAGISHDLRTPLTRMKLEISMMENQKEHKDLLKDIKEMEEMLKGYIDFTKGGQEEKTKKVNFNEYLSEIVKTETKHYKDGFIDVHFEQNIEVFLKPKSFIN